MQKGITLDFSVFQAYMSMEKYFSISRLWKIGLLCNEKNVVY